MISHTCMDSGTECENGSPQAEFSHSVSALIGAWERAVFEKTGDLLCVETNIREKL